jgi:hypothetical protein
MKRSLSFVVSASLVAVVAVLAGRAVGAQTPDPLVGTWKMDIAKSKFDPGPAGKSSTAVFAAAGSGLKVTVDTTPATGDKTHFEYTAQYDGKEAKVTGNPDADTIVMKRTSARVTESVYMKGGKATLTNTRTVSADGKTLTVAQKGTNAKGEKVNNLLIYTKS